MKRKKWLLPGWISAIMFCLLAIAIPAAAGRFPVQDKMLDGIFGEAKADFFGAMAAIIERHPMKTLLPEKDLARVINARTEIPYLFERLMIFAYQKDEPLYSAWIAKGDKESMDAFRSAFRGLAKEYAAKFIGSLFRKTGEFEFVMSLPHNAGKSRLDLVLQSIGFNADNSVPDVPEEKRFTNTIEPDYLSQWAIDAVNARKAWAQSRGSGVVVAVVDSGIDPFNAVFKGKTVPGFNFLERTTPPWSDENPPLIDYGLHGTGCSSILLAIAPDCRIMPVRTHDSNTMNDPAFDLWASEFGSAGIYYAVHHGAQVISCSMRLPFTEPAVAEAVRYAWRNNVVVCSSAGNISRVQWGLKLEDMIYKAMDKEVVLVGGVEKTKDGIRPWPYTVPNPLVDVAAPSDGVFVLVPVYMKGLKDDYVAGTSLSAPIAAGVVALIRSSVPPSQEILAKPGAYCRLVNRCLQETARLDILGLDEPDEVVGHGLLDAVAAIELAKKIVR
jgi:hypothetical protein